MLPFRSCATIIVAASLGVAACNSARADTIILRDGTEHDGQIILEGERQLTLRVRWGGINGTIVIPKAEIAEIRPWSVGEDLVLANARKLQADAEAAMRQEKETKRAARLWMQLADYFQRHPGYSAQAREALERAMIFDPDNPDIRAKLGFVKTEKGWAEPAKPASKEAPPPPAALKQPQQQKPDELTIGLRREEQVVRKLLDDKLARRQAELAFERPSNYAGNYPVGGFYGGGYLYNGFGPDGDFLFFTPAPGFAYPFGSAYYSYGPPCYSRCATPFNGCGRYYGSGLNIGFSGRFGSTTRFSGSFFSGYSSSGCASGFRF